MYVCVCVCVCMYVTVRVYEYEYVWPGESGAARARVYGFYGGGGGGGWRRRDTGYKSSPTDVPAGPLMSRWGFENLQAACGGKSGPRHGGACSPKSAADPWVADSTHGDLEVEAHEKSGVGLDRTR